MRRSAVLFWALTACARIQFPLPYSPTQLARDSVEYPGEALAHYLSQADADPAVCDVHSKVEHAAGIGERGFADLVGALVSGRNAGDVWARCVLALVADAPPPVAAAMLDAVATTAADVWPRVEKDPPAEGALVALTAVIAEHPIAAQLSAKAQERLATAVAEAQTSQKTPARARPFLQRLDEAVELDRGRWHGTALTVQSLEGLEDQALLRRFVARLADPSLREAARRRIVMLSVAQSKFPEVRERPEAVLARVLATGRNAVPLEETAVRRTWFEPSGGRLPSLVVRQDVQRQRCSLLSSMPGQAQAAIVPTLDLKGALFFELVGVSRPTTFCAAAAELSPDPCVDAAQIDIGNRAASLDENGVVHLADDAALVDMAAMLERGDAFTLRPSWTGHALYELALPLAFERPADLVLWGGPGRPGPRLEVRVMARSANVVFWTQNLSEGSKPRRVAVVRRAEAGGFHVVSQGGRGLAGTPGTMGAQGQRGQNGMSAMCPSSPGGKGGDGSAGGRGGDGGPGGSGGDGGAIKVLVDCAGVKDCAELARLAEHTARSEAGGGGPGGPGGMGGQGGDGGSGGSGTTCYSYGSSSTGQSTSTSLSGGSNGSKGATGANGTPGRSGTPGEAGKVEVVVGGAS